MSPPWMWIGAGLALAAAAALATAWLARPLGTVLHLLLD